MASGTQSSSIRGLVWNLLRLGVTLAAVWYVVTQITWHDRLIIDGQVFEGWARKQGQDRILTTFDGRPMPIPAGALQEGGTTQYVPGILSIFGTIKFGYLLGALALFFGALFLGSIRWQWLMQSHGINPGLWQVTRINWMGYLSNNVLPGSTGGDLVKAVSIARRSPGKKTAAVMTVLLDRVVGFVSVILLGGIGVGIKYFRDGAIDSSGRLVLLMASVVLVGGTFFFSRRVRKILRVSDILDRIPLGQAIKKVDDAVFHYHRHKWQLTKCIGMGLLVWICTIIAIYLLGQSVAMPTALIDYFIFSPIIFTAGAVFPSIAGLGVLEGLFQTLFGMAGAPAASAVAVSLLYRLNGLVVSLPGAIPLFQEFSSLTPSVADPEPATDPEERVEPAKLA
ncbi:flippase-like domain-containing protein [bacterium]|nr:flippase-like domain-containing protein [bacterium]